MFRVQLEPPLLASKLTHSDGNHRNRVSPLIENWHEIFCTFDTTNVQKALKRESQDGVTKFHQISLERKGIDAMCSTSSWKKLGYCIISWRTSAWRKRITIPNIDAEFYSSTWSFQLLLSKLPQSLSTQLMATLRDYMRIYRVSLLKCNSSRLKFKTFDSFTMLTRFFCQFFFLKFHLVELLGCGFQFIFLHWYLQLVQ